MPPLACPITPKTASQSLPSAAIDTGKKTNDLRREDRSPKGGHPGREERGPRVGRISDTCTNAVAMPLLALFDAETAVAPRGMSLERSQAQEPRNRRSFEKRTKVDESLAPFAEVGEEWSVLLLGGRNYIAYEENECTVRRF